MQDQVQCIASIVLLLTVQANDYLDYLNQRVEITKRCPPPSQGWRLREENTSIAAFKRSCLIHQRGQTELCLNGVTLSLKENIVEQDTHTHTQTYIERP